MDTPGAQLLAYAAIVFAGLGARLLKVLGDKYRIQADIHGEQQLRTFVLEQIMAVREEAARRAKAKQPPLSSDQKLTNVLDATLVRFPHAQDGAIRDLVHAQLAQAGEGATQLGADAVAAQVAQMFGPQRLQ